MLIFLTTCVCPPGNILISYETYAHVSDQIVCKEHRKTDTKGTAYPVATLYDVLPAFSENPAADRRIASINPVGNRNERESNRDDGRRDMYGSGIINQNR